MKRLILCLCVGAAGCVGISDRMVEPESVDAGVVVVPGVDGGASENDAGTVDAGSDAGTEQTDSGVIDSGTLDAGVDAGCPGFFCDDFEKYSVGSVPGSPWTKTTNGGTVAVDAAKAASGGKSVHLTVTGGTSNDSYRRAVLVLENAPFFPVNGNDFFGRVRIWINNIPAGNTVHYSFIAGSGYSAAAGGDTLVKYGAMNYKKFLANYWETPTSADCWQNSATAMPEGRWACLEWQYDGPNDTARLWLDGVSLTDMTVAGTGDGCVSRPNQPWHFPNFTRLEVGWQNYQLWTGQELWMDDFALGTSRLGCGP